MVLDGQSCSNGDTCSAYSQCLNGICTPTDSNVCQATLADGGEATSGTTDGALDLMDATVPNVAPSELVVATAVSERNVLCNWIAKQFGGYDRALTCDAGSSNARLGGPANLQDCNRNYLGVALWPAGCPLTVAQLESCVEWETQNVCLLETLPSTMRAADCQTLLGPECLGGVVTTEGGTD